MNNKKIIIVGAITFLLGVLFGFSETVYFLWKDGFHVLPSNNQEAMCDWISYTLVLLGGCTMVFGLGRLINSVEVD